MSNILFSFCLFHSVSQTSRRKATNVEKKATTKNTAMGHDWAWESKTGRTEWKFIENILFISLPSDFWHEYSWGVRMKNRKVFAYDQHYWRSSYLNWQLLKGLFWITFCTRLFRFNFVCKNFACKWSFSGRKSLHSHLHWPYPFFCLWKSY